MDQANGQESKSLTRRQVLWNTLRGGVGLGAMSVLGACASKPGSAITASNNAVPRERRAYRIQRVEVDYAIVIYDDGFNPPVQYSFTIYRPATRSNPQMDCEADPQRPRRPMVGPGAGGVLDGLHNLTQRFKLWGCDAYFSFTQPVVDSLQQTVNSLNEQLNRYEIHRDVYGSTDEQGRRIRAAADPNRLFVVEPFFVQSQAPSLGRRLLARSTNPKPTARV